MNTKQAITVNCPTCKKQVLWTEKEKYKPFCCERCKLIDLGEWAMENNKIPGEPTFIETEDTNDTFFH